MSDRKVTREAAAAETKLNNFRKRHNACYDRGVAELSAIEEERLAYVAALPDDVRKMLVAGGVLEGE